MTETPTTEMPGVIVVFDLFVWALLFVAVIWIAISIFEAIVRRRHNLTRAETASVNKDVKLDFLSKDKQAQDEALAAADAYKAELGQRDAPAAEPAPAQGVSGLRRVASAATAIMAAITVVGIIAATIMKLTLAKKLLEDAGFATVTDVLDRYQVGLGVAVLVIGYHAVTFFTQEKWRSTNT